MPTYLSTRENGSVFFQGFKGITKSSYDVRIITNCHRDTAYLGRRGADYKISVVLKVGCSEWCHTVACLKSFDDLMKQ